MPGEEQIGPADPEAGVEILDIRRAGLREHRPVHLEAGIAQHCAMKASAPPSFGVTEGQRMRAWARVRAVSIVKTPSGGPACFKTSLAVCRDWVERGTVTCLPARGLNQISWLPFPARTRLKPFSRKILARSR
jgi:hypothetical protein